MLSSKLQLLIVLVVGGVLGYAAANYKLNPFQSTEAAPAVAASPKLDDCALGSCCEGANKAKALAQVDVHNAKVNATAAQAGKKPNIVVIMGDDIGIWNIGAYHRGMMGGRTPHLDKLAKEGVLFTDY